jgi:LSD1 subclass zinc finger protein
MLCAPLHDHRCRDCRKLLFRGLLIEGTVEIKCKHCHAVNEVSASNAADLLCMIPKCPNRIFAPSAQKKP